MAATTLNMSHADLPPDTPMNDPAAGEAVVPSAIFVELKPKLSHPTLDSTASSKALPLMVAATSMVALTVVVMALQGQRQRPRRPAPISARTEPHRKQRCLSGSPASAREAVETVAARWAIFVMCAYFSLRLLTELALEW